MSVTTPLLAEHRAHGGASEKSKEDCGSTSSAGLAKKPTLDAGKKSNEDCRSNSSGGLAKKPVRDVDSDLIPRHFLPDSIDPRRFEGDGFRFEGDSFSFCWQEAQFEEEGCPSCSKKLDVDTLADAAAILSRKFRDPVVFRVGKVFADRARKFAANLKDVNARGRLVEAGHFLGKVTKHTPDAQDVQDILKTTDAVLVNHFIPASVWTAYVNERKKAEAEPNLRRLRVQAGNFCALAAASSMAGAAVEFSRAVEKHSAGKDRGKKVAETNLHKAGLRLFHAASEVPPVEKDLADIALKLTEDSCLILLTPDDLALNSTATATLTRGRCFDCDLLSGCCRCCSGYWPSMLKWIRSGPELTLPVHHKHQAKLAGKRQVLYAIALGTPVALLTSAASLNIFPSWIAGATVFIWLVVSAGMVANQYGTTHLELMAAINLSRLGMVGVCMLLCVYAFWAFFPSHNYILWLLLVFAAICHGGLCILSRVRGDDDILTIIQVAEKPESINTGSSSEQAQAPASKSSQ